MERKKIFLSPIVLTGTLLILIFCFLSLIKNNTFKKYYSMNVTFPDKGFTERNFGYTQQQFLKTKKFIKIELTGNEKVDNELLSRYQLKIRQLVKTKDSILGVHLKLNRKTKYHEYIKALDICVIENATVYIFDDYDVWVTNTASQEFRSKYHLD